MRSLLRVVLAALIASSAVLAEYVDPSVLDACPGYNATHVSTHGSTLTATLVLAGQPCNVFGNDTKTLHLEVDYETESRIHVKITDPSNARYEVPDSVLPRPKSSSVSSNKAAIHFGYTASPFSFNITRSSTKEVLFSTTSHPLVWEPQYLRLKTNLPPSANIYGLGESTNPFRLDTFNTTRTLWSRDAYGIAQGTNLYGNHPIYIEHRETGTHGVFLLSSNGMDVKINETEGAGTTLEYNVIGGVFDFYFLAGSESDPTEVIRQYAEIVGNPAEVPYWSLGLHQCRFGYQNFIDVSQVIVNYSAASIPLETMWTDIDYMDRRRIFTVDPQYFPLDKMREIVHYLHDHDQRFVLMTDPAVPYLPGQDYEPYNKGHDLDVFLHAPNGSESLGLVWPGVTVFPDWFSKNTQSWWSSEFASFYSPSSGIDIDGAWIDMNEPSSFCLFPCDDPFTQAVQQSLPPPRSSSPPDPNTPIFGNWTDPDSSKRDLLELDIRSAPVAESETPQLSVRRATDQGFNLLFPPYNIEDAAGGISNNTEHTDVVHSNGLVEYDTHNIYGTMMSVATRMAMLARRPGLRTLVITRSTFAGAGAHVGKWLGDNFSDWDHYRWSIAGMLNMASIFHVPMVGSDICGYAADTTETLCARWALLGGFYPFMRNHNADTSISQEFYRWPTVAQAAQNVLSMRYRLMDYLYTAIHQASVDVTPVLNPLFYKYPKDANTYPIDLQFLFGPSILVSPVTDENSTSVDIYLPKDNFYDFETLVPIKGSGANVSLSNISFTEIPVYIRSGAVLPLRVNGTMTTTELRRTDFEFVVAPTSSGQASGSLYMDDGVSIAQKATTTVSMSFSHGKLDVQGSFKYATGVDVARVRFAGVNSEPKTVTVNGKKASSKAVSYDEINKVLAVAIGVPFNKGLTVEYK